MQPETRGKCCNVTLHTTHPVFFPIFGRYFHSPTDTKELLYDPASVMNDDTLKFCQKEAWCKMSFFMLSFFYYLYWWVSTISTASATLQLPQRKPKKDLNVSHYR